MWLLILSNTSCFFWQGRFFKWSWTTSVVMAWWNNWLLDLFSDGIVFFLSKFCFNVWIGCCDNTLYRAIWVTVEDSLRLEGIWEGLSSSASYSKQGNTGFKLSCPQLWVVETWKHPGLEIARPACTGLKSCSTVKQWLDECFNFSPLLQPPCGISSPSWEGFRKYCMHYK